MATPSLSHAVVTALPAHRAGVGSGISTAARALGTALTARSPGACRPRSPATRIRRRGSSRRPDGCRAAGQAVAAFTGAVATGYRIVAVLVLVAGACVAAGLRRRGSQPVSGS